MVVIVQVALMILILHSFLLLHLWSYDFAAFLTKGVESELDSQLALAKKVSVSKGGTNTG